MNITINIPENATNGDVIKDILNPYKICEDKCLIKVYLREEDYWEYDEYIMTCNAGWWNMPYNSESEEEDERKTESKKSEKGNKHS